MNPGAALTQATDGNFYGTTTTGGNSSCGCDGTIFKITPTGTLTTLYDFDVTDGSYPYGNLVQAAEGKFYGTTRYGGAFSDGTVFSVTSGGVLTTLYSFCAQTNCTDGAYPFAGLVLATDGNFYGTTSGGGNPACDFGGGCGTVFEITEGGKLTTLYDFCSETNCSDGSLTEAGLVQATNGNLYGAASDDGADCTPCYGTAFEMTPAGELTTMTTFGTICSYANCLDGQHPTGLVQATDGSLYGTTSYGGVTSLGVIFRLTLNRSPVLNSPIADQSAVYGTPFNFAFAANTFTDPDAGQTLSYTASNLPPAITFSAPTRAFSGTPSAAGTYAVTVTATDAFTPPSSTSTVAWPGALGVTIPCALTTAIAGSALAYKTIVLDEREDLPAVSASGLSPH